MRRWFKDHHFRRLLKNSTYLAVFQGVSAVAGIATAAFAGRALGVALFGMLVLISSYAQLISGISKFQSWQMVVRYGGRALASEEPHEFKQAIGFALGLDIASGIVGMAAAMALLPSLGRAFGIPDRYLWEALLYCTLVPTIASATPDGVLRSLDRFDLIARQDGAASIVRAVLAGLGWATRAPFWAFVLIWYVTTLGSDLWLWFLAWRELRRRKLLRGIRPMLRPRALPGAWRFAIHTNLYTTLLSGSRSLTPLLVGALLGPAATGLYRVASSAANIVRRPADLLLKAYYPEIVAMDFASSKPWKLMLRSAALAGAIALVVALVLVAGGRPLIAAIFGRHFLGAYAPLLVLCIGSLLGMLSFPLPPMLYSLDRTEAPLKARAIGTGCQILLIAPLVWALGLVGAAAAQVIGYAVSMIAMMMSLHGEYRRVRTRSGAVT